ncbi:MULTISPECIES: rhamnogalacturonan lyase [unclassified Dysgonomonas]|jgi:rhamnogalacturonan endolyase|uniref:rhamnogalacturonan lyase n=1 Tax=unclassified Dysgonomonas TaxID=2630389 RepID=UPI0025BDA231|nr:MULTISPECIES: rhamnogalacturonan lyase [unclassified Dysgonomonas]MDR2005085.1 rhamnogalacturonan lyase [Prevotella sp.]HMM02294.1 rhamnogalacturonan lyase [Dysgonomonas sp.]
MKYNLLLSLLLLITTHIISQPNYNYSRLKREKLGRGLVAVKKNSNTNSISWRYLSSDASDASFNIYRNGKKINSEPVSGKTYFEDKIQPDGALTYQLKQILRETEIDEQSYTLPADAPVGCLNIPLDIPSSGITPDGQTYTYAPNDASVGDVDGDGEYEVILKWDPSNAHDNSHNGYTGNVYIDCYKLSGEKLWRIDLGQNIRAGAHYTQFMVYDLDNDGKAEIVMKTADGTVDGKGNIIGKADADYRNKYGFIIEGPEYLTVFNGQTGEAMSTIDYIPQRGDVSAWGDTRGNRVDRFLACVAYLDGEYPSVVMCRGYYTRTVLAAFDWRKGKLTNRWVFDSDQPGNGKYAGQGNHNLRVGDVDGDGCDEIIYGSCAIDHDGTGLYSTQMGHGDAMHMTVFDPRRKGMQVWDCHENRRDGSSYRDAATGEVLFQIKASEDVGRCMAADIDPEHTGVEMWSHFSNGIYNVDGQCINPSIENVSVNMACWWDGDLLRELLDKVSITKYDYKNKISKVIFSADECLSNNGTKATPCLQGDIIGDWREEVLFRTKDNKNLRLYVSTNDTGYRFHSFLEDPVYRISIATQNVAYNQPAQSGFYFGADLGKCFPVKDIVVDKDYVELDAGMDYDSYSWSVGGNERIRKITTKDIPAGKKTRVELTVTYRGYEFKDYVYITFK